MCIYVNVIDIVAGNRLFHNNNIFLLFISQSMEISIVLMGLMAYWPMPTLLAKASVGTHTLTRMKTGLKTPTVRRKNVLY